MSPGFGAKAAGQDDVAAMQAEIARMGSLPLHRLAAEVMIKGFGPDGPGGPGQPNTIENPLGVRRVELEHIAREFTPAFYGRGVGPDLNKPLMSLIAEGLQVLEHAALIRVTSRGGVEHYLATRRGREVVQSGDLERILDPEIL